MDNVARPSDDLRGAIRVTALYLLLSVVWIPLSDVGVSYLTHDEERLTALQTMKGWFWVALTSVLLFVLVRQALGRVRESTSLLAEAYAQRELVLRQAPLVISTTDRSLILTGMVGRGLEKAGLSPNEGVGRPLTDLARTQETKDAATAALNRAVQGDDARFITNYEGRIFDTSLAPLRTPEGDIDGVIAVSLDVTELHEKERELRDANTARARLLRRLVEAEEAERERIAAGLHDGTLQELTSAGMAIDLLISGLDDAHQTLIAERAREMVGKASVQLRTLVYELKPEGLERDGLAETVRRSLERATSEVGAGHELKAQSSGPIPATVGYLAFRLIREAIINACRHAAPSVVSVRLNDDGRNVWASISDDGRGFDPAAPWPDDHFGLRDMEQRATAAGGWFKVESRPGEGTTVEVCLPFTGDGDHET